MLKKKLVILIFFTFIIFCCYATYKIIFWRAYIWLPNYFAYKIEYIFTKQPKNTEKHIIFIFCDHFEPGWKDKSIESQNKKIDYWCKNYRTLVQKHRDSDGYFPRHTWFYAVHERNEQVMLKLNELVREGFGEIEYHLHHDNDNSESLAKRIKIDLAWLNKFGACVFPGSPIEKGFCFIHGMWTLDNSDWDNKPNNYCGVNNELEILKENGCFADFAFPCLNNAQPAKINSIYYAHDTPLPKSYNNGVDVTVGGKEETNDFMIIEGAIELFVDGRLFDNSSLDLPPSPRRVDAWVKQGICVKGRPEWIFVKVYAHTAFRSRELMFGKQMDEMFSYLEKKYNKRPYYLHYVTAREAYNIVKAAEAGLQGNPNNYRDFLIKPPLNSKNKIIITQSTEQ